jgi:hypothetical protein
MLDSLTFSSLSFTRKLLPSSQSAEQIQNRPRNGNARMHVGGYIYSSMLPHDLRLDRKTSLPLPHSASSDSRGFKSTTPSNTQASPATSLDTSLDKSTWHKDSIATNSIKECPFCEKQMEGSRAVNNHPYPIIRKGDDDLHPFEEGKESGAWQSNPRNAAFLHLTQQRIDVVKFTSVVVMSHGIVCTSIRLKQCDM